MNDLLSKVTINGMPYYQYISIQGQTNTTVPKKTKSHAHISSTNNTASFSNSTTSTTMGIRNNSGQKLSPKVGSWPIKTQDGKYLKTQVLYQELGSDTFAFNFLDKEKEQVLKLEFSPKNGLFKIADKAAIVSSEFTPELAHGAGTQIIKDSFALGKMPPELKNMIQNVNKILSKIRP